MLQSWIKGEHKFINNYVYFFFKLYSLQQFNEIY
jgi:hypothetical protein